MSKRYIDADELIKSIDKEMLEGNKTQNVNTCVCCNAIIPEGRQVCPKCNLKEED